MCAVSFSLIVLRTDGRRRWALFSNICERKRERKRERERGRARQGEREKEREKRERKEREKEKKRERERWRQRKYMVRTVLSIAVDSHHQPLHP